MTCTEFEILLADSLDGTLTAECKDGFERHQASCPACAELARDARSAVAFMGHIPEVVPPVDMVNRILAAASGSRGSFGEQFEQWFERWFKQWLGAVWQPQFAMGVALAILSLAIATRFWPGTRDGAQRAWERTVKGYENMQLVYEVQTQIQEWGDSRDGDNK